MVKCLVCGKEFENGFGPEICPACLGDVQSESSQPARPEEYNSGYGMFIGCKLPDGLTLGNEFDTSNANDMSAMFAECRIPRFKVKGIGNCPSMSASEYEESARSIVRKNKIKSALNALLDLIDRSNENEA